MTQKAAALNTAQTKRAQSSKSRSENVEKQIMGVPARIMRPRLILIAITAVLVCFGFVMIFSASSVEALSESGDAAFYVKRQIGFALGGLAFAIVVAWIDYHSLSTYLWAIWAVIVLMLLAVWALGKETNGASRWIQIGFFRLQPSEFAKPVLALAAANIANAFYGERSINSVQLLTHTALFVGVPVGLIVIQPDNGTVGIIVIMLFAVLYYSGFPRDLLIRIFFFVAVVMAIVIATYPYARQRVLTMLDPSSDPYNTGWQLNQGFIAFGSGGLFGVGIGMSRQKYSYLPEAHNDFIFAIIGEELGLVGTLFVVALFFFFVYEAIQIARQAPDLLGRLLVIGSTTLLITQFFINAMGVLGLFPLSGKPMPFLSYGGSSIVSSLVLVALIVNVSKRTTLPDTVHDQRRRALSLAGGDEDTGVGEAQVRSGSSKASSSYAGSSIQLSNARSPKRQTSLSVLDGGKGSTRSSNVDARYDNERSERRSGLSSSGYTRINLHESPQTRLRKESGPKVAGTKHADRGSLSNSNSRGRGSSGRTRRDNRRD